MSYILEALRRADADRERERGGVPGLHARPMAVDMLEAPARTPPAVWLAAAGAALALLAVVLWWARRSPVPAPLVVVAPVPAPAVATAPAAAPAVPPPGMQTVPAQTLPQPPQAQPASPAPQAAPLALLTAAAALAESGRRWGRPVPVLAGARRHADPLQ